MQVQLLNAIGAILRNLGSFIEETAVYVDHDDEEQEER